MFGRLDNTVQHATDDKSTGGRPSDRRPSMVGGWAKAMGWGSLAVAGCVAVLLLVAPNDMRGAEPEPCEQVRDQVGCSVGQLTDSATVPTMISTPGQVPFARSPTP